MNREPDEGRGASASRHLLDALLAGDRSCREHLRVRALVRVRWPWTNSPFAVPDAAVATDIAQPRDGLLDLAAELALHHVLVIYRQPRDQAWPVRLRTGRGLRLSGADPRPFAELVGEERPNPINIAQRDHRALVIRDVDTEDTRHPSINLREAKAWLGAGVFSVVRPCGICVASWKGRESSAPCRCLWRGFSQIHVHLSPAADDLAMLADRVLTLDRIFIRTPKPSFSTSLTAAAGPPRQSRPSGRRGHPSPVFGPN